MSKFQGKIVSIRGALISNSEYFLLEGHDCTVRSRAYQQGPRYPGINLRGASVDDGRFASALIDTKSLDAAGILFDRAKRTRPDSTVLVTFTGILEADNQAAGYGHMGALPAQLVYTSARDVRIVSQVKKQVRSGKPKAR